MLKNLALFDVFVIDDLLLTISVVLFVQMHLCHPSPLKLQLFFGSISFKEKKNKTAS